MITILAGTTGTMLLNGAFAGAPKSSNRPVVWRGVALGAESRIILHNSDPVAARALLERCHREILRLENLFSLYRRETALVRLNREGRLGNPEFDMLELLSRCQTVSHETKGAFDITVQPLWQLYSAHFLKFGQAGPGPDKAAIRQASELVDYRMIELSANEIKLKKKGMALTLNGIAQGFITNRIAKLLRHNGYTNTLIDLGEIYAMGHKPSGLRWRADIAAPGPMRKTIKTFFLKNSAMATSGAYGTTFSADGKYHHLFDPRSGMSAQNYKSVTVIAPDATMADAYSTAFSAMQVDSIKRNLRRQKNMKVIIVGSDDEVIEL